MRRSWIVAAGGLVAAVAVTASSPPPSATEVRVAVGLAGCKPAAPVDLAVLESRVVAGVLSLRYTATPRIEAVRVAVEVSPEPGALLSHVRAAADAPAAGVALDGSARVRLPQGAPGGRVWLEAAITFEAVGQDSGATGPETHVARLAVEWGDPDGVMNVRPVTSGGTTSLDVPASRTKEGGR